MTAVKTEEARPTSSLSATLREQWELRRGTLPTAAAVCIFVIMLLYGQFAYGHMLQMGTISNLLINNSHLIILAVGGMLPILTGRGGIDLSVGSIIAFSGLTGVMLSNAGLPWPLVLIVMIGSGTIFGTISGILIQYFDVQPFIATLAMMFLARGLASVLSTVPIRLEDGSALLGLSRRIKLIDGPKVNDLVIEPGVIVAILVVIVAYIVLQRSRFGRTIYAIGGSEQSAQLMGLSVHRTKMGVYMISGTLAGLAAVVYTSRLGMAQNITGIGWELNAIAAVVIGGTLLTGGSGYVLGSVVGALVLGLMNVLITRDGTIPPEATTIITGCILLIFVLLQRVVSTKRSGAD